jgi:hypothetical protein
LNLNDGEFRQCLATVMAQGTGKVIHKRGKVIHMDSECPGCSATMTGDNVEKSMSKREQFLAFVWVGALAQDFSRKTNDTALVMHMASKIPEDHIPDNVMNAAKVFLAYCNGLCKRPHHWMLARK